MSKNTMKLFTWFMLMCTLLFGCGGNCSTKSYDTEGVSKLSLTAPTTVYNNGALTNSWYDASWTTRNFNSTTVLYNGAHTLSVTYKAWESLCIDNDTGITAGTYDTLSLYVYGGTNTKPAISVAAYMNNAWGPSVSLANYCDGKVIPTNAWTHCAIPLSTLGQTTQKLTEFTLSEAAGKTLKPIAIANIQFMSNAAPQVAISVSPITTSLITSATQQFTASITGTTNTTSTWAVQELGGGTVNSVGLYTAPLTVGTFHVVVTSAADTTKTATATVTVTIPPVVQVVVTPTTYGIYTSTTQQLTATVTGTTDTSVAWTVTEGTTCGSVTNTGLFTASTTSNVCHVVATSNADTTKSATSVITVSIPPPPQVTVTSSPTTATIYIGSTQQLTATVTNATDTSVVWSVTEGTTCGLVTSSGLFTASTTANVCHVVATSNVDTTKSATSVITVVVPPSVSVTLSPVSSTIYTSYTQQLTATVTNATDTSVVWSVTEGTTCGLVTSSGLFTASTTANVCHVVATSNADTTKSATSVITVVTTPPVSTMAMPHISVGKPAFANKGTASLLTDGAYRAPNAWTFSGCSVTTPCWGAVNVGVGPSKMLVDWSYQDGTGGFDTQAWGGTTVTAYSLMVSSNSTNGSDGIWVTATDAISQLPVVVSGNHLIQRSHLISFTGYSWVKIAITSASANEIDELDLWDASLGNNNTFFFHGDSITHRCANMRGTNVNYGEPPSFQLDVQSAHAAFFPLQVGGGIVGQGTADAVSELPSYMPLFKPVKYWFLTMGTNDLCGGSSVYAGNVQNWITAVKAGGAIPILVHPIWGNNVSAYCYQNGPSMNAAVDALVLSNGLMPAVPLYEATVGHSEYFDSGDVHPNYAGCDAWNKTFAAYVSPMYQ